MAKATDAAEKKAAEEGVDIESLEGSGKDGQITVDDVKAASGDGEKFLVRANPEVGSYSHTVYTDEGAKVFYRDPNANPDGPEAQLLSDEEFARYNGGGLSGLSPLVKLEGG